MYVWPGSPRYVVCAGGIEGFYTPWYVARGSAYTAQVLTLAPPNSRKAGSRALCERENCLGLWEKIKLAGSLDYS